MKRNHQKRQKTKQMIKVRGRVKCFVVFFHFAFSKEKKKREKRIENQRIPFIMKLLASLLAPSQLVKRFALSLTTLVHCTQGKSIFFSCENLYQFSINPKASGSFLVLFGIPELLLHSHSESCLFYENLTVLQLSYKVTHARGDDLSVSDLDLHFCGCDYNIPRQIKPFGGREVLGLSVSKTSTQQGSIRGDFHL